MCAAENSAEKIWLVGGGLPEPWTYADLFAAIGRGCLEEIGPLQCVADALIRLTSALHRQQRVALGEATFAGEGQMKTEKPEAMGDDFALGGSIAMLMRGQAVEIGLLTSGTTGRPKTVTHTLRSLSRAVAVGARHRDDVWGLAFNPTHIAGVQVFLQALANGNSLVNLWGIEREEIVERCHRWGVTHLSATPTFYRLLLAGEFSLPAVRSISIGGDAAEESLLKKLRARFPGARLHNIYASTEAGTLLVSDGDTFALPVDGSVRIAGRRLWVHRSALGRFDGAGEWYDTGDAVEVVGKNPLRFRIVGRERNEINVGGEKVNPHEVEAVLGAHSAVAAARVFGRKNSVTGEILAAEIVTRGTPPDEAELRDYLAGRLPPHKIPRIIRCVERLDLTRTGKLRRDV
jgi:acyl-CoA synthetase (AMP-forming)/AMP-acid ligase II